MNADGEFVKNVLLRCQVARARPNGIVSESFLLAKNRFRSQ